MKFIALFLFIVIVFVLAITFGANNNQIVEFNYFINQREFRLSTLLAILLASGFLLGWFTTGIFYITTRLKLTATQRKLKKMEKMYETELATNRRAQLMANDPILPT